MLISYSDYMPKNNQLESTTTGWVANPHTEDNKTHNIFTVTILTESRQHRT